MARLHLLVVIAVIICKANIAVCQDSLGEIVATAKGYNSECWRLTDSYINMNVDSLNFAEKPIQLPKYLKEYLYDWAMNGHTRHCTFGGEIISYRKAIIDRVIHEDVLDWIISSSNKEYDKRYVPKLLEQERMKKDIYSTFPDIRYMEMSWRDLAKMRLEEIRKRKKLFSNGKK